LVIVRNGCIRIITENPAKSQKGVLVKASPSTLRVFRFAPGEGLKIRVCEEK